MASASAWTPPEVPPDQQVWPQNLPISTTAPFSQSNFSTSTGPSARLPSRRWNGGPPGLWHSDRQLPPPERGGPPGLHPPWNVRPALPPPHQATVPMTPSSSAQTHTSSAISHIPPVSVPDAFHVHPAWHSVIPPQTTPYHPRIHLLPGPAGQHQRPRLTRPDGSVIQAPGPSPRESDKDLPGELPDMHLWDKIEHHEKQPGRGFDKGDAQQPSMYPDRLGIPLSKYVDVACPSVTVSS